MCAIHPTPTPVANSWLAGWLASARIYRVRCVRIRQPQHGHAENVKEGQITKTKNEKKAFAPSRLRARRDSRTRVGGAGHDEDLPLRGQLEELGEQQRDVFLLPLRTLVVAPAVGLVGPLAAVPNNI